jgi:hypothetical protein
VEVHRCAEAPLSAKVQALALETVYMRGEEEREKDGEGRESGCLNVDV